jgi:hypothetical protein
MGQADLIKHFPQVALDQITSSINKLSKKVSRAHQFLLARSPGVPVLDLRRLTAHRPVMSCLPLEPDQDDGHGCQGDQVEGGHKERGKEVSPHLPELTQSGSLPHAGSSDE